ncbi:hypothetical protein [Actinomadura algeriensis]|uniref:AAA+ ATPase domain-containing protein n=1 Tax=Actinomadura algeriensis TaxID=1679523 RepID=A0ABR9K0R3_9ACTN|nr:hypothetical protein [Actinomadura algeriensis]MBE1536425.1 hypothetical protein [Actinomadura algeriensis]
MSWQGAGVQPGGTGGGPSGDLFTAVEGNVRELVASPWWQTAPPPERAAQIAARMLWGAGEWWLYGAWGRWYRCGLDGAWHPCPPPGDPADRAVAVPAPRGAGTPPVPPQLFPTGPDLSAGRVAPLGFLGPVPDTPVVARVSQAITTALAVNPAQFVQRDPMFQPGTPSTIAAAWGTLLWCAGSPVVLTEHPLIESFIPFLTTPAERLHWMMPPDFGTLAGYYVHRLGAGDGGGAAHIARVMYEVAAGLQADPRFRPGADALAAVTAASLRMVNQDMATVRYGPEAILQEWRRRCPAEFATPMVRDTSPGEFLRLGLYDLQQIVAQITGPRRPGAGGRAHDEVRRAGVAVLAADLQAAPGALPALQRWLDPDSARTAQAVLTDPAHPGRALWPRDGRLPDALRTDDADALASLLATTYTLGLTWCRLAQVHPPATGFAVPQAAASQLTSPAMHSPPSTDELSAWDIIKAARAHMAAERAAAGGDEPVAPVPEPQREPSGPPPAAAPVEPPAAPPVSPAPGPPVPAPAPAPPPEAVPAAAPPAAPVSVPGSGAPVAPPEPPAWPQAEPGSGAAAPAAVPEPQWPGEPHTQLDSGGFATQLDPGPAWPGAGPPAPPDVPPDGAPAPAAGDPPPPPVPDWAREGDREPHAELPPPPAPVPAPPPPMPPAPAPAQGTQIAEAYGVRFLCGADDIQRVVTEVRRRGKWARRLRGQQVSSASAPALLLIGGPSSGQRRLARMVARALAEVEASSGEVRSVHGEDLRDQGPEGLRAALEEHAGHVLLLDGLDSLILDEPQGAAYATVLYRTRLEGVNDTALLGTCGPDRVGELSAASPELVTDLRAVRLPDLAEPAARAALVGLLAQERGLRLGADAQAVVDREIGGLRPRGRLTGARLIEAYLDRAATRRLGRAEETQALEEETLSLSAPDFAGLAAELSGR